MKRFLLPLVLLIDIIGLPAQKKDTITIQEVVVTGQYSPHSIKKSLYKVEVLNRDDLRWMSANNVAEALTQMHNLLVVPEKIRVIPKPIFLAYGMLDPKYNMSKICCSLAECD